jgi:glycosyltransferase involved in cell wall biosynthesis
MSPTVAVPGEALVKVCMIAYTLYPGDPRVRREAEALAGRGDEVHVICLRERNVPRTEVLQGVHVRRLLPGKYRGGRSAIYLTSYLLFLLLAAVRVTLLHLTHRYRVIQVHTMPDFLVFACLLPRVLGARIVLDVHDLVPELYMTKFGASAGSMPIRALRATERLSVGFAHRAIAVSESHLDALVRHGNRRDKFIVLLNTPDPRYFRYRGFGVRKDFGREFRLVYHGSVERRYGLDTALRAVALLEKDIPGIRMCVIGDGTDTPRLLRLAEDLGIAERVAFEETLPFDVLVPRLVHMDVGVIPLVVDGFTRFTIPTKMLEYAVLGIPTLITGIEAVKVYFTSGMARYFRSSDAGDLAFHLKDLYGDPGEMKSIAENARAFSVRFGWEEQKKEYFRLLDGIARS